MLDGAHGDNCGVTSQKRLAREGTSSLKETKASSELLLFSLFSPLLLPTSNPFPPLSIAVETFYSATDAKTGLINVKRAQDATKANRAAENLAIDLQVKTVPELLEYLTHRDFDLRARVVALLKLRAIDSTSPVDVRNREYLIEQITAPNALVSLFNCSTIDTHPALQSDTLLLVSGLLNEPLKDKFRQVGCFPVLAALWDRNLEESLLQKVLSLTQELTTIDQNCMACKQTKRISEICYLFDPGTYQHMAKLRSK